MSSPIDQLFHKIYGYTPSKDGEAYERIASAVCKILSSSNPVFHDQRMRGLFSKSLYQIDVQETTADGSIKFGEAKDYTETKRKVGRGDLQKLGGALGDLPVESGMFFSATNFTKPAKQYAKSAAEITGKPIDLFHLRPTTEKDLDGRILSIHIHFHIVLPDYHPDCIRPIWTRAGEQLVREIANPAGEIQIKIEKILDTKGAVLTTINELTSRPFGGSPDFPASGCFLTPNGHIEVGGQLIGILGFEYNIPFTVTTEEMVIKMDGSPTFLLKNETGASDKIITDEQLRNVKFNDKGESQIL